MCVCACIRPGHHQLIRWLALTRPSCTFCHVIFTSAALIHHQPPTSCSGPIVTDMAPQHDKQDKAKTTCVSHYFAQTSPPLTPHHRPKPGPYYKPVVVDQTGSKDRRTRALRANSDVASPPPSSCQTGQRNLFHQQSDTIFFFSYAGADTSSCTRPSSHERQAQHDFFSPTALPSANLTSNAGPACAA